MTSWRRDELPTPVFWPGEFHGQCSPWGHKESDTPERLSLSLHVRHYVRYIIPPPNHSKADLVLFSTTSYHGTEIITHNYDEKEYGKASNKPTLKSIYGSRRQ